MALRSRTRTVHATSGPGRGLASDGRVRHRSPARRVRSRKRQVPAEELRRRAEILFGQRGDEERQSGPPGAAEARAPDRGAPTGPDAGGDTDCGATVGAGVAVDGEVGVGAGVAVDGEVGVGAAVAVDAEAAVDADRPPLRQWLGPAVRERMPVWLQTRCGLERRSVVALTVLLVVAAVLAVQHFWTGRTETVSAPQVVRAAAPRVEEAPAANSPAAARSPAATGGPEIVVDVGGKVRNPGIHRLPAGSRVADALRAAGGVRPGTDLRGLNRARFLVDGEQVLVGEPRPAAGSAGSGGGTSGVSGVGGVSGAAAGPAPAPPVSLNTATVEQLDALPGVGPVLAQHIIDYRAQHGGFRSVDELREVNGIGARRFADLRELVTP